MNDTKIIKSISFSQDEIIQDIIKLYNHGESFDLDPTYSKGNFYRNIAQPKYKSDIAPQSDDVHKHDCRELPFEDDEISSIMFDPPFLATTGKSLSLNDDSNKILKRFGYMSSEKELYKFYTDSMAEFARVLKKDGLLVFKCQDKVSGGKQYITHNYIINEAEKLGFVCEDIFILLVKNRIIADWQRNQKHSRKYHSYFIVFKKL